MADEHTFRAVTAAIVMLGGSVGAYHRLRAKRLGAPVTRADEPLAIRVPLRAFGLTAMALLLAWLIRPGLVAWAQVALPAWLRWAGAPVALAAVPLLAWTFHTLGLNLTDTVATRDNSYLVTGGPYRFVRHPFYATGALFLAGLVLLTALWPCAVLGCVVLSLLALRTPIEEQKLIDRFGGAYREYAARTGRYFPRRARRVT